MLLLRTSRRHRFCGMSRKIVVQPASPPPAPSAPPPRLVVQLFVATGELLAIGVLVVGLLTVFAWITKPPGPPVDTTVTRRPPSPWQCWQDRYGEHCDRLPPRRHLVRD